MVRTPLFKPPIIQISPPLRFAMETEAKSEYFSCSSTRALRSLLFLASVSYKIVLSYRVIARKKGTTPPYLLLFESEKRVCCREILLLGTEDKGNYGPLYEEPSINYKVTEHSKRYLSNLFSPRQGKVTLFFWLSQKSLARKGGEPFSQLSPCSPFG